MKKLRLIRYELVALLLLLVITVLELTLNMPVGKTVNIFFPCQDVIGNSFPCYGKWDVLTLVAAFFVTIGLVVIAVYKILRHPSKKAN